MSGENLISWPLLGGGVALLCGAFFCYPYVAAVWSGVIVRKGSLGVRVRRDQDPEAFAGLLKNRSTHLTQGVVLVGVGAAIFTLIGLAGVGVGPAQALVRFANALPVTILFGVAFVACLIFSLVQSIVAAMRAGRFGLRHMWSRGALGTIVGVTMFTVFFYGWFAFPDAPYRQCVNATGYCGKWGVPHTLEEYTRFSIWQTTLLIVWPIGMLLSFILGRGKQDH